MINNYKKLKRVKFGTRSYGIDLLFCSLVLLALLNSFILDCFVKIIKIIISLLQSNKTATKRYTNDEIYMLCNLSFFII